MSTIDMLTETSEPFDPVTDLIYGATRQVGCAQRAQLDRALLILTQCAKNHVKLNPDVQRLLEQQAECIKEYRSHQNGYPSYKAPLGDSLLPVVEDTGPLLSRLAHEVLDDAELIAEILSVPVADTWKYVNRERRSTSGNDMSDYETESVGVMTEEKNSHDEEQNAEIIQYKEAYH